MNPSWYDLLGVEPDASDAEIRSAWKAAIEDLDPTDRRFRTYNQAAEVLLDPKRRKAYDAELAAQPAEPEVDEPEVDEAAEPQPKPTGAQAAGAESAGAESAGADSDGAESGARRPWQRWRLPALTGAPAKGRSLAAVPGWALIVLAVLTAASVAAAAWLGLAKPSDAAVEDATSAAQSSAERAVGPILSYDYRHLDEDQQAAESYMTSQYRSQYDDLFAVIKQNAPDTKTVVKAQVVASGIVRSGDDRVDILLFVNRPTTNKARSEPTTYRDQVTVTMQNVGGEWLVDDMRTSPVSQ